MYEIFTKNSKRLYSYFSFIDYYNYRDHDGTIIGSVLNSAQQNNKTEESIQLDSVSKMGVDYFQNHRYDIRKRT